MTATPIEETISSLNNTLNKLQLPITAVYRAESDGLKDGIVFEMNGQIISQSTLNRVIDFQKKVFDNDAQAAGWRLNAPGASVDQKRAAQQQLDALKGANTWMTTFKKFAFENRTTYATIFSPDNFDAAIISEATAGKEPFQRLLKNDTECFCMLTPIKWDLHPDKTKDVVKALNNIALMEGQTSVHFQLEQKTGKITYFSNPPEPIEELHGKVSGLLRKIVAQDKRFGDGEKLLENGNGHNIAAMMDAFKPDRHYVSFEPQTDYSTANLVDLVENAQISLAAKKYLNFKKVSVTNEEQFKTQNSPNRSVVEDGRDKYSYENWNLTSARKGHVGEFNELAPIPGLTTHDEITKKIKIGSKEYVLPVPTNKVTDQPEGALIKTLEEMRGALPIELSPDPEPEAAKTPKPVHKAKSKQEATPAPKKQKDVLYI